MIGRRLLAGVIDAAIILGWALCVVGVWLAASWLGWTTSLTALGAQLIVGVLIALPILVVFAVWEAGSRQGTLGKQKYGLRVHGTDGVSRIGRVRALFRNVLKIFFPLLFIHLSVLALLSPGADSWIVFAVAILLPASNVISLFIGDARTPYDYVVGSVVTERASRVAAFDETVNDGGALIIESTPRRAL